MTGYLRDPAEIYRRSFAVIREEARLDHLPPGIVEIAVRVVHACGMVEIVDDLAFGGGDVAGAATAALTNSAPILCDARMVAEGVIRSALPADSDVVCTLHEVDQAKARELGTTRSAAAVDLWADRLGGAVVAIGNAPTALFRLLEMLQDGAAKPAAIFAFPVGFVGAAESKDALIEANTGVPYLTLRGRRGGSAMAAAAVNAVAAAIQ
ncbi:MAG TPA: precorrin-8X methylmutase [Alphaproteobacteria bacterium]|nr:precorrin-8X methylmutase [Alphaproteobacteria bacterium]